MDEALNIRQIDTARLPSVTDQVFDELYARVVELDLPPGTKLSEAEVARRMGVSRQPVRDAFYRLSQLGFLLIRPQRATIVMPISTEAVMQARFIRTALEMETVRAACAAATPGDLDQLDDLITRQQAAADAGDKVLFHALDDEFHNVICALSGHGEVWALIRDNKAHMDRVRWLSLDSGTQMAIDDHVRLLARLRARDGEGAAGIMREHLERIGRIIEAIRAENEAYFEEVRP